MKNHVFVYVPRHILPLSIIRIGIRDLIGTD